MADRSPSTDSSSEMEARPLSCLLHIGVPSKDQVIGFDEDSWLMVLKVKSSRLEKYTSSKYSKIKTFK